MKRSLKSSLTRDMPILILSLHQNLEEIMRSNKLSLGVREGSGNKQEQDDTNGEDVGLVSILTGLVNDFGGSVISGSLRKVFLLILVL